VHAHERAGLAGGAGGQVAALDEQDVAHAERSEVEGRAGAVHATADDDDVGRAHGAAKCSTSAARP
jgi:hypothetical protein